MLYENSHCNMRTIKGLKNLSFLQESLVHTPPYRAMTLTHCSDILLQEIQVYKDPSTLEVRDNLSRSW